MQEHIGLAHLTPLAHPEPESSPSGSATAPRLSFALDGEVAFVSPEVQAQRVTELLGAGAIVVEIGAPPASMRGRLAELLDERVERALGVRGAPSPYVTAWSTMRDGEDAAARLADQLFRARSVGASGIAIVLGTLARIAAPALTPEDSAALRVFARVACAGACVVLVDDADEGMAGYGEPVGLGVMLGVRGGAEAGAEAGADAHANANANANANAHENEHEHERESESESESERESESESGRGYAGEVEISIVIEEEGVRSVGVAELVETHVDAPVAPVEEAREAARKRATVGVPVAGPTDFWRSWAIALGSARGPQPLGAFERLFAESYMPLANAIAEGLDDPRALRAHDEFSSTFERSYSDAFATFGASSRRPRLVMDAFDVASKQARLHNARSTHVLVVDAMRYDIGCLVRDDLAAQSPGTASLTSESLLWSALPTTTFRQLETLARGMDALRAPASEEGSESLRGRSAETVRRLRVGSREVYKLDVIPSMLSALPDPSVGPDAAHVVAALKDIAASVTDAILRHVETLPPRTLLLVLGDHGFTIDKRGRITDGGATPEEVLVPCLAYLVGDLH